jgi:hypothetical protein
MQVFEFCGPTYINYFRDDTRSVVTTPVFLTHDNYRKFIEILNELQPSRNRYYEDTWTVRYIDGDVLNGYQMLVPSSYFQRSPHSHSSPLYGFRSGCIEATLNSNVIQVDDVRISIRNDGGHIYTYLHPLESESGEEWEWSNTEKRVQPYRSCRYTGSYKYERSYIRSKITQ